MPERVRVDVGYYALGGGPSSLSAGTRESLVGVTLGDGHAYRDGRVRGVRSAERVRLLRASRASSARPISRRRRRALRPPGARIRGLREVNVYPRVVRAARARPLQAGSFVGGFVRKIPLTTTAMRLRGRAHARPRLAGPELRHDARQDAPGSPPRPSTLPGRHARPRSTSRASTATRSPRASWPGRRSSPIIRRGRAGPGPRPSGSSACRPAQAVAGLGRVQRRRGACIHLSPGVRWMRQPPGARAARRRGRPGPAGSRPRRSPTPQRQHGARPPQALRRTLSERAGRAQRWRLARAEPACTQAAPGGTRRRQEDRVDRPPRAASFVRPPSSIGPCTCGRRSAASTRFRDRIVAAASGRICPRALMWC